MFLSFAKVTVGSVLDLIWYLVYDEKSPSHQKGTKPSTAQSTAPQSVPSQPVAVSPQPPSLSALIIAINEYKYKDFLKPLKGAIADAQAVKDYLEKKLGVPENRIQTLFGEAATHDRIIQKFRDLQKSPDTKEGDPILIYYAGHGVTGEAPDGWDVSHSTIELLAPHDIHCREDKTLVNAIPDHTIGMLLDDLARAKGDNITVIFDCCHSGSLSRGSDDDPDSSVRGFELPEGTRVSPDQDKPVSDGGGTRGARDHSGFLRSGLSSHVLLAACSAKEQAKEAGGRGNFTNALLATLSDVGPDKVTYTDLIKRLPILPAQNPQCEGVNRNRLLFDGKAPSQDRHLYAVQKSAKGYVMDAGAAHGITEGAIFEVYKNKHAHLTTAPLGTMTASAPGPFSTVLDFSPTDRQFSIEDQAFALQIRAGKQEDLTLYVPLDENLLPVFHAIATEMQVNAQRQINMLTDEDLKKGKTPDVGIAFENPHIVFDIKDPNVTVHGLTRMPQRVLPDIDEVAEIINAAAHYYWHLRRVGNTKYNKRAVEIEFTKLSGWGNLTRRPDGPNLIKGGVVDIVVDEDDIYGMKITNHGEDPLYASVFYFDNSNWSIMSYYQPPTAKDKLDPCIQPNGGFLTIGYGAGGAQPFSYGLDDEQDIDVGCVKIFLSTEKVDLSSIPQASPFDGSSRGPKKAKKEPRWYTTLFTVVQRKG